MNAGRGTQIAAVVAVVVIAVILLEAGRQLDVSAIFTGLGWDKALVIGAVVVLAVVSGWYLVATRRRSVQ